MWLMAARSFRLMGRDHGNARWFRVGESYRKSIPDGGLDPPYQIQVNATSGAAGLIGQDRSVRELADRRRW